MIAFINELQLDKKTFEKEMILSQRVFYHFTVYWQTSSKILFFIEQSHKKVRIRYGQSFIRSTSSAYCRRGGKEFYAIHLKR